VKGDDLVLGTHGRSIWILDDLTPVRALTKQIQASAVHVFPVPPVTAWRYRGSFHEEGPAQNPPPGLTLHYWLKTKPTDPITLEVYDAQGALVRSLSSKAEEQDWGEDDADSWGKKKKAPLKAEAGVNRGQWDLAYAGATKIRKARIDWGSADDGPFVLPGTYTLKLKVGAEVASTTVEVKPDPRVTLMPSQRAEQLKFALEVREAISRLSGVVEALRSVRSQILARGELVRGHDGAEAWTKAADALVAKLDAFEAKLHNPKAQVSYDILAMRGGASLYSQIIPLYSFASETDGVPTQGMRELFGERSKQLATYEAEWKDMLASGVGALNASAKELNFDFVATPK
jgi:hypothetical protein